MNVSRKQQLLALYEGLRAYDAQQPNRLRRWRNLEPESAELLALLVRSQRAKHVLELGTSNGYSALWLADALETTKGQLTTLDIDSNRTRLAQQHLEQFGLAGRVSCLTADAGAFLVSAQPVYDLIFLDAERSAYVDYVPDLSRLLIGRVGCLLVVDNVLSHAGQVSEFIHLLDQRPVLQHVILPVGAGLLLCVSESVGSGFGTSPPA